MRSIIFIISLLVFNLGYAQSSLSFDVQFDTECEFCDDLHVSEAFRVEKGSENLAFVGVSGYYLNKQFSTSLYYRYESNGQWSEWHPMYENHEAMLKDRKAFEGDPIESKFDKIQFKSGKPTDLKIRFRLYFPGSKTELNLKHSQSNNSLCSCVQPNYCDRTCWCPTNNCPKDPSPSTTNPSHVIVHHSAGFNTSSDFAAVVAYYWDLHVNTNGWDDIGYNWLIDPNGVVYEGRGDGIRGAHFSCMNGSTVGVCLIGNFENQKPTSLAINRLKWYLAWEGCEKGIRPNDSSYHSSSMLVLDHISGHRDGNNSTTGCPSGTVCPGDSLYLALADIRFSVDTFPCLQSSFLDESLANRMIGLNIYPNPASHQFSVTVQFVDSREYELEILDSKGTILRRYLGTADNSLHSIEIKAHDLNRGVYWARIKTNDGETSKKFILN